jgi:hypothetical protein
VTAGRFFTRPLPLFLRFVRLLCLLALPVWLSESPDDWLSSVQGGGLPDWGSIERVSLTAAGGQAAGASEWPAISADGRFVVFHSSAANIVANDTNGVQDVFLFDRLMNSVERSSLSSSEEQGNNRSSFADVSADGRYVAFHSEASNLVADDTNNAWDVFVRDRLAGTLERVSLTAEGHQANGGSVFPDLSADGRFVAYYSDANNIVPNDTNNTFDVFLYDRQTATTQRISVSSAGGQGNGLSYFPDISADGRYTVYESDATNLVANDTNGVTDSFIYDRITGTTQLISVNSAEEPGNGRSAYPVIAANNRHVTFVSFATNLSPNDPTPTADIYIRDLVAGTTQFISPGLNNQPGNNNSHYPVISADGRFVAYHSEASNLVPGDTNNLTDVFLYNRVTAEVKRVSLSNDGVQGNGPSSSPAISGNGRFVVFQSDAGTLVPGDTNGAADVFLYLDFWLRSYIPAVFR